MRMGRVLRAFCLGCLILSPCLPLDLHAQTVGKEDVAGSVHCTIEVEAETWSQSKPIIVGVQLKNITDRDVKLLGIYTFELRGVPPIPYWSPADILSGKPLELEYDGDGIGGGRVPRGAIHLEPGETKALRFDLSNLLWNISGSSRWPHQRLFEVVPKGDYDLLFSVETDQRLNADNIPDVTHIPSNSVRIVVE